MPLDAMTEAVGCPSLEDNLAGTFELIGERHELGSPIDWQPGDATQLWRFHLHYFDWAWVLLADPDDQATAAVASLYRSWAAANPVGRWDSWSPYAASVRAWTLCALAPCLHLGDELDAELARHARYLRANLEFDIGGNHLLKNLKALLGLAVFLGDDELLRFAGRHLARQINVQVLADGGHYELSPGYHAQVLGDLIDVAGLLEAAQALPGLVAKLVDTVARMQGWMAALVQPDGSIPMLNDSVPVSERRRIALGVPEASRDPLRVLDTSGYVVLRPRSDVCLVMDVGAPCPPELPAHAHADALSITLQVGGKPVLVDTGTSIYGAGERRQYERSTRAHNTVEVDGTNQTEVWGAFRAGRRHRATLHALEESADGVTIRASHDGYRFLPGEPVHQRTLRVSPDQLRVEDVVTGRGSHRVRQFWHLAQGTGFETEGGATIVGEARVSIDSSGQVSLERVAPGSDDLGSVAQGHSDRIPAPCLVVTADQPELPATIRTTITW